MYGQPVPCVGRSHDKMAYDEMFWQNTTAQDRQDGDFTLKRQLFVKKSLKKYNHNHKFHCFEQM